MKALSSARLPNNLLHILSLTCQYLSDNPTSYAALTRQSEKGTWADLAGRILWCAGTKKMLTEEEVWWALQALGFSSSQSEELMDFEGSLEEVLQCLMTLTA